MPVTVIEKEESRSQTVGTEGTRELVYAVFTSYDENEIRTALALTFPAFYDWLPFQSYELKHLGGGIWEAIAHYSALQPAGGSSTSPTGQPLSTVVPKNDFQFTFEYSTEKHKITQIPEGCVERGRFAVPPNNAPDTKGAIGVSKEEGKTRVEGVEIRAPVFSWSETFLVPKFGIATFNLLQAIMNAPVNDAPFRGCAAGEVMLEGMSGSQKDAQTIEMTFKFTRSITQPQWTTPNGITIPERAGWDYLWFRYNKVLDAATGIETLVPSAAYIVQVYRRSNFALLGIGV